MTKETFLAIRQSCQAIVGLSRYLINECGFKYILLGKIQSDNIESRFGHIRQLSGANYYLSMRQLLESDRKLRALSLIKYSKISVNQINEAAKTANNATQEVMSKAESLYGDLSLNIFPTKDDATVIFYVTGYCCRSLVRSNKCDKCREVTVAGVEEKQDASISTLFSELNRDGLCKPTPELFDIGCLCWRIFSELSDSNLRKKFLSGMDQQVIFQEIVSTAFYEGSIIPSWTVCVMCDNGHNILDGVALRFFNCMSKNLVRDISESETLKSVRKIRKLTGQS